MAGEYVVCCKPLPVDAVAIQDIHSADQNQNSIIKFDEESPQDFAAEAPKNSALHARQNIERGASGRCLVPLSSCERDAGRVTDS